MTDWGYSKNVLKKKKDNTKKFEIDKFITLKTVKKMQGLHLVGMKILVHGIKK